MRTEQHLSLKYFYNFEIYVCVVYLNMKCNVNSVIVSTKAMNGDDSEDEEDPELEPSPPPSPGVDRDIKKTESRGSVHVRNHVEKVCSGVCACMM